MFGSKPKRKIVLLINFEMNEWILIKEIWYKNELK